MSLARKFLLVAVGLIVIVFAVYVVRSGLQEETHSLQPSSTPAVVAVTSTPTNPPFIVNIPQKALMKNYVEISVEAPAETECTLTFIPSAKEMEVMKTTADENGLCTWKWKVDETTGRGNARVIFTINGVSETRFLEILPGF